MCVADIIFCLFLKKNRNMFSFMTENQYICSPKWNKEIKTYNKFILTDNDKSRNHRPYSIRYRS